MKKLLSFFIVFTSLLSYGELYNFKATIKVPTLNSGVRTYVSTGFTGYLDLESNDLGEITNAYLTIQNSKSKVIHDIILDEFSYGLLGKSNKHTLRSIPEVYFHSTNDVLFSSSDTHELITEIAFSGCGSLKIIKSKETGCGPCGDYKIIPGCNKISKLSGNLTGKMACECPEDSGWDHTLIGGSCGVIDGELEDIRTTEAAIWGTWSATLMK